MRCRGLSRTTRCRAVPLLTRSSRCVPRRPPRSAALGLPRGTDSAVSVASALRSTGCRAGVLSGRPVRPTSGRGPPAGPSTLRRTVRTAQPRSSRSSCRLPGRRLARPAFASHCRGRPRRVLRWPGASSVRSPGPLLRRPPIARRRLPGTVAFGTPALRRSVARCAVVRRSFACGPRCRWREQFLNPRPRARKGFDHAIFQFSVAPQEFRGCPQTPAVVHGFVHRLSTGECTAVGDGRPERRSVFLPFAPPRPAGTGGP
jgi:hypothetical protein